MADTGAPIFVVGAARSGTTLLQALLGAHPAIAAPPEMHWFLRVYAQRDYWGDLASDDVVRRVVAETVNLPGGMLAGAGFDVRQLTDQVLGGPRNYRAVLETVMSDFATRHRKRRWSEKTPHQLPEEIWEVFPDAQLLHIVRDPRDVAASVRKAPFTNTRKGVLGPAETWLNFNRAARTAGRTAPPGGYHLVRYEDLCNNPESVMTEVFRFLGEEPVAGLVDDLGARSAAVASAAWWTHNALQPVRPVIRSGSGLPWPSRAAVGYLTAPLILDLGYRPAGPAARSVGWVILKAAALRRRLLSRPPQPLPTDPEQRHRLVGELIDASIRSALNERSRS